MVGGTARCWKCIVKCDVAKKRVVEYTKNILLLSNKQNIFSLIFLIAEVQAVLTVLSLSAIVTNGNMRGGGSYFMISRTLGPEFGGSVGILFYSAYCVGVAFYSLGFAEELVSTWYGDPESHFWVTVGYASLVLFCCMIVAVMGARWFTKVNVPLFVVQFAATILPVMAMFTRGRFAIDSEKGYYHYPWSAERFKDNWARPKCDNSWTGGCYSFRQTFGVLFPAATGIMEGANLSGDLATPSRSIPLGTLLAVLTAIVTYVFIVVSAAGAFTPEVLINRTTVMQDSSYNAIGTYFVVVGVLVSALSSGLGALEQKRDEPRRAVLFTWVIAQLLCLIGTVNTIAPLTTAFFCISYATVNLSCFLLQISGAPNFRPEFKYVSWHLSLLGFVLNIIVMFYVDYIFGLGAVVCTIMVFAYLIYRSPPYVWGDVTQSVIYHQVRKYLLLLDERKMHSKLWRPSILLLVDNHDLALIDFCNNLKKGGVYVIGSVVTGEFADVADVTARMRRQWLEFIDKNNIKAFPQICISPTPRVGYENILLLCGLGAMQPNIVVLPFLRSITQVPAQIQAQDLSELSQKNNSNNEAKDTSSSEMKNDIANLIVNSPAEMSALDYLMLLKNILQIEKNVVVTDNFTKLDYELLVSRPIKDQVQLHSKRHSDHNPSSDIWICFSFFFFLSICKYIMYVCFKNKEDNENKEDKEDKEDNEDNADKKDKKDKKTMTIKQEDKKDKENKEDSEEKKNVEDEDEVNETSEDTHEDGKNNSGLQKTWQSYWTKLKKTQETLSGKWVDVWIWANAYTYDLRDQDKKDMAFPMLMMQLAHIIMLNRVWDKKASLRVMLVVDEHWTPKHDSQFGEMIRELRLKVEQVVPVQKPKVDVPQWQDVLQEIKSDVESTFSEIKATERMISYYQSINQTMHEQSKQTQLTFLALPQMPPISKNKVIDQSCAMIYFQCLSSLVKDLPPTAMVATGQSIPVISVDI
ncbi:hypothetical protein RFI_06481 [Reticulomyxa filosa]|uniref:Uncharacterized protein n=1 Tax=Reticulomyxa filosa TaxID=46433 RepID=X6NWF0_RETFI|nr:hypothetical protein RFI_06481 [Reticulomyxa filosa]|eukprot:ETO30640.1 hypothetical protein RFI_06481 [Reticulomyxa filosa]